MKARTILDLVGALIVIMVFIIAAEHFGYNFGDIVQDFKFFFKGTQMLITHPEMEGLEP